MHFGGIQNVATEKSKKAVTAADKIELGRKYLTELNYTEAVASFTEAIGLDPENIPGNTPGVNHSISTECRYLTSEGASLFSAYLPESVAGICGMDREAMLNYLGITDEMMSWLCNPNVKQSQAFNEYESIWIAVFL